MNIINRLCKAMNMAAGQSVYAIIYHVPVNYHIIGEAQKLFKDAGMFMEVGYYKLEKAKLLPSMLKL